MVAINQTMADLMCNLCTVHGDKNDCLDNLRTEQDQKEAKQKATAIGT